MIYVPNGSSFAIPAATVDVQVSPSVAVLDDGRIVAVWQDNSGAPDQAGQQDASGDAIKARIFSAAGAPATGDILVNETTLNDQSDPHVKALAGGGFAVVWSDASGQPDGDSTGVKLRLFDGTGTASTDESLVNATLTGSQAAADLAQLTDGRLMAVWRSAPDAEADGQWSLVGRILNPDGSFAGEEMTLAVATAEWPSFGDPSVTALADGGFTVVWTRFGQPINVPFGTPRQVDAQIFGPSGQAEGDVINITQFGSSSEVAALSNGQFAVAWARHSGMVGSQIFVDIVGSDGTKIASTAASDFERFPSFPTVEALAGGGFVVAWSGGSSDGQSGVFAQVFDAAGAKIDEALGVGPGSSTLDLADLGDGSFAVAFYNAAGDVLGRLYHPWTVDADGLVLVDDDEYRAWYPDVAAAGIDPELHYDGFGWREGRDPNAFFSTQGYLAANGDVAAAGINPLEHYANHGWKEGRDPSVQFDTEGYLGANADVAAAGIDPLEHYLRYGLNEGRTIRRAVMDENPQGGVDTAFYRATQADVAQSGVDALFHFNTYGWKEGRDPNAYFDTDYYLAQNPDVAAAGLNPLEHYNAFGWKEGRDPSQHFDTDGYLAANGDVAAAGLNPLQHFLDSGIEEGRSLGMAADFGLVA